MTEEDGWLPFTARSTNGTNCEKCKGNNTTSNLVAVCISCDIMLGICRKCFDKSDKNIRGIKEITCWYCHNKIDPPTKVRYYKPSANKSHKLNL